MSTENAFDSAKFCEIESTFGYLLFHAEPAGVEAVQKAREILVPGIEFLDVIEDFFAEAADESVAAYEAVELMSVHGEMADAVELPDISLIDGDSDEVGHDLGKALVVISLNPDDFDFALGIGELANAGEKLPVITGQSSEIEVAEDVAQEDEPPVFR